MAIGLATNGVIIPPEHSLAAPTLLRSQALALVYSPCAGATSMNAAAATFSTGSWVHIMSTRSVSGTGPAIHVRGPLLKAILLLSGRPATGLTIHGDSAKVAALRFSIGVTREGQRHPQRDSGFCVRVSKLCTHYRDDSEASRGFDGIPEGC